LLVHHHDERDLAVCKSRKRLTVMIVRTLSCLKDAVLPHVKRGKRFFGLDGASGAGKTPTAKLLVGDLDIRHIEVDKFLVGDGQRYADQLDCEALRAEIEQSSRPVLIEAVCLLEAAKRCAIEFDILIYISSVGDTGSMAEDRHRSEHAEVEELERENRLINQFFSDGTHPKAGQLPLWIAEYSRAFKPKDQADIVFELWQRDGTLYFEGYPK